MFTRLRLFFTGRVGAMATALQPAERKAVVSISHVMVTMRTATENPVAIQIGSASDKTHGIRYQKNFSRNLAVASEMPTILFVACR